MKGITIDWSQIDWKWVVTTVLAVYAAGISTYRELANRRQWRPDLGVRLSLSIVALYPEGPVPHMQIWVENRGRCDILFNTNSVAVEIKGKEHNLFVVDPICNVTFPHTLRPGGSFYYMKPKAPLIEMLKKDSAGGVEIRALVQDAIVRPFYSDWQTVDLNKP